MNIGFSFVSPCWDFVVSANSGVVEGVLTKNEYLWSAATLDLRKSGRDTGRPVANAGNCSCAPCRKLLQRSIPKIAPAFSVYRPSVTLPENAPALHAGKCSCISGIQAIHGHKKGPREAALEFLAEIFLSIRT
jgi:hypothetical protein